MGMRSRWTWLLVVVAAAAAATGFAWHRAGRAEPPPAGPATLVIYQSSAGGALYTEGSRSFLSIAARAGGAERVDYFAGREVDPVYSGHLAAGTYTLTSWQRPCDGNCGYLDPPTDRCGRTITLVPGAAAAYTIELMPGRGCRIR